MKRIPHSQLVSKALRSARAAVQKALKGLNLAASQRMARGDYPGAEGLAERGKQVRQFQEEVEHLQGRWREVCGFGGQGQKGAVTPLWLYYQPILQGLVQAGGRCRRPDIEENVERVMGASLKPVDREPASGGRERWRVMVRRARKALVAEGWIEDRTGIYWIVTDAGRRAAEKPMSREAPSRK